MPGLNCGRVSPSAVNKSTGASWNPGNTLVSRIFPGTTHRFRFDSSRTLLRKGGLPKHPFLLFFQSLRVVVSFVTVNSWKSSARLPLLTSRFSFVTAECQSRDLTNTDIKYMIGTSSYDGHLGSGISSRNGFIGNPVQIRDDPVTVSVSRLQDVTEA